MRKLFVASAVTALLALSATAHAHVTVSPPSVAKGSFAKLAFSVPNERDNAKTVKVEVNFPEAAPIAFVSVRPVPGWTVRVEKRRLSTPLSVHGTNISDVVSKVTWEGGSISAGEFQIFEVSAGPLPESGDSLAFPSLQTYDNGEVVRWIEPTPPSGEEPEHPVPSLTLAAATGDERGGDAAPAEAVDEDDDDSNVAVFVSIAALVVALGAGVVAMTARRRRDDTG